jgi:hypothetical protein
MNTPACFDHNSYGDGALLCNTTTLFSVTEKKPSDGHNRQVLSFRRAGGICKMVDSALMVTFMDLVL